MAIQDTRWQGEAIIDLRTHMVLLTARTKGEGSFVVAFIIGNRCKENILSFQPISEKKHTLRKKTEFINITCINIHAPTEDK
jgi:hypothetical protein